MIAAEVSADLPSAQELSRSLTRHGVRARVAELRQIGADLMFSESSIRFAVILAPSSRALIRRLALPRQHSESTPLYSHDAPPATISHHMLMHIYEII
jgi:hypothetical protein